MKYFGEVLGIITLVAAILIWVEPEEAGHRIGQFVAAFDAARSDDS